MAFVPHTSKNVTPLATAGQVVAFVAGIEGAALMRFANLGFRLNHP